MNDLMTCTKTSNSLLTFDTTYIAGYECVSEPLYFCICGVAILIQVGRNFVWTKNSQAMREALKTPISRRMGYIHTLLWYTLLSMLLYIGNILLILGSNLGILLSVLIGNLLGTYLSIAWQKADKARTAQLLKTMVDEYNELEKRAGYLTGEERIHLKNLKETQGALYNFLVPKFRPSGSRLNY